MAFIDAENPIAWVSEPDAAVGMDNDVVRGIERLALPFIGENGDGAGMFVADDAACVMLARELTALPIKRISVRIVRRRAEGADVVVFFEPAQLPVVGNIAPDKIASAPVPGRPLSPAASGEHTLHCRIVCF